MEDVIDRFKTSEIAERLVFQWFLDKGYSIRLLRAIPQWVRSNMRFNYDNDIALIKHFPDAELTSPISGNHLLQIKAAPNGSNYPTLTIEQASLIACKRLSEIGVPVILWWITDNGSFWNYAKEITPIKPKPKRHELKGSQTPMFLVPKKQLKEEVELSLCPIIE